MDKYLFFGAVNSVILAFLFLRDATIAYVYGNVFWLFLSVLGSILVACEAINIYGAYLGFN